MSATSRSDRARYAYVQALAARAAAAHRFEAAGLVELAWAMLHHRNTRGDALSFANRDALVAIYKDRCERQVFVKSVQEGFTELMILRALAAADRGWSVLYVLPNFNLRDKFVHNRIGRLIDRVAHYKRRMGHGASSVRMKHFGNGVLNFVGSNVPTEFVEFPADYVIVDEADRCDPDNVKLASDRVQASPHRWQHWLGNPTVEGGTIWQAFVAGDARRWMLKCTHCGEWQALDFFRNVVRELEPGRWSVRLRGERDEVLAACVRCGKTIDRSARGEWVAEFPGRPVHSYHLSKVTSPTSTLDDLYAEWLAACGNESSRQVFYNSRLGLPYSGTGARVSDELLDACVDPAWQMPAAVRSETVAGVDVGSYFHVKISHVDQRGRRAVFIGRTANESELVDVLRRYRASVAVIDLYPEPRTVERIRDQLAVHGCRVYGSKFWPQEGEPKPDREATVDVDDRSFTVTVDRTRLLDNALEEISFKRVVLPAGARDIDGGEFYAQMRAPTRIYAEPGTPGGGKRGRFVWREGALADHYRFADAYELLATYVVSRVPKLWSMGVAPSADEE